MSDSNDYLRCSFCGKGRNDTRVLITGPCVCICDECVVTCCEIIEEHSQRVNLCWCPGCGASESTPGLLGYCGECGFPLRRDEPGGVYIATVGD
jgi:hypothetical protein